MALLPEVEVFPPVIKDRGYFFMNKTINLSADFVSDLLRTLYFCAGYIGSSDSADHVKDLADELAVVYDTVVFDVGV